MCTMRTPTSPVPELTRLKAGGLVVLLCLLIFLLVEVFKLLECFLLLQDFASKNHPFRFFHENLLVRRAPWESVPFFSVGGLHKQLHVAFKWNQPFVNSEGCRMLPKGSKLAGIGPDSANSQEHRTSSCWDRQPMPWTRPKYSAPDPAAQFPKGMSGPAWLGGRGASDGGLGWPCAT